MTGYDPSQPDSERACFDAPSEKGSIAQAPHGQKRSLYDLESRAVLAAHESMQVLQAPRQRVVSWARLSGPAPHITERRLPPVAPVLMQNSEVVQNCLCLAHGILMDLVGDVETEVELHHDCEWNQFREVGLAVQRAGGQEECLCVAICVSRRCWAVGLAGKWKTRESLAKLALCVSLAWQTKNFQDLCLRWPQLAQLCVAAGYMAARKEPLRQAPPMAQDLHFSQLRHARALPAQTQNGGGSFAVPPEMRPPTEPHPDMKRQRLSPPRELHQELQASVSPPAAVPMSELQGPLPAGPMWLRIPHDKPLPPVLDLLPREAPALPFTVGEKFKRWHCTAQRILADTVGYAETEEVFYDDPEFRDFPQVAEALRYAGAGPTCYSIATCPKHGKWAVGLGDTRMNRFVAAEIALCMAVTWETEHLQDLVGELPEIAAQCDRMRSDPTGERRRNGQGQEPRAADLLIHLPSDEAVPMVLTALPKEAIALSFNLDGRARALEASAQDLLEAIVGDVEAQVEIHHDPECAIFPQVGKAVLQGGYDDQRLCLAICPHFGRWAVGLADTRESRENMSKVALGVTLAWHAQSLDDLVARWPAFGPLCIDTGMVPPGTTFVERRHEEDDDDYVDNPPEPEVPEEPENKRETAIYTPSSAYSRKAPAREQESVYRREVGPRKMVTPKLELPEIEDCRTAESQLLLLNPVEPSILTRRPAVLPKDLPLWIRLPLGEPLPAVLESCPREALVLNTDCSKGERKILYNQAEIALDLLTNSIGAEVTYHDDANWEHFPGIGAALLQIGEKPECMGIAVCAPLSAWGIGVGTKCKSRYSGAKVALAAVLVLRSTDIKENAEFAPLLSICGFAEQARLARERAEQTWL